jgi:pimeloyl-ACP methyl ester carboxylesterase
MTHVLVAGTWGDKDVWWRPGSPVMSALLNRLGWVPLRDDPFVWSMDLDGTWWSRVTGRLMRDWIAAAYALCYYCGYHPDPSIDPDARARAKAWKPGAKYIGQPERPVLIAHSHGGQVALLATGVLGLPVSGLVTVSTPVRQDVLSWARPSTPRPWLHLYDPKRDWWQRLGALGDWRIGLSREMPIELARNVQVPGYGHSGLLERPDGAAKLVEAISAVERWG